MNEVKRPSFDESGFLIVDKPEGLTSMDVVRVLRRICRPKKIGHGGTLDPFATGVLPILLNRATKLSENVMGGIKEYEGTLFLGLSYDTQDMTGKPQQEMKEIPVDWSVSFLQEIANQFIGEIDQTPPLYSAVKKGGRPLYDYARAGETVAVESRKVIVEDFRILERADERHCPFYVRCHKGVYVRTLVHDFGQKLGIGAVVEKLTRTQTGRFHLDDAVPLSTFQDISDIKVHLKPTTMI